MVRRPGRKQEASVVAEGMGGEQRNWSRLEGKWAWWAFGVHLPSTHWPQTDEFQPLKCFLVSEIMSSIGTSQSWRLMKCFIWFKPFYLKVRGVNLPLVAACVTAADDVNNGSNDPSQWWQEIPAASKQDSAHIGADILEDNSDISFCQGKLSCKAKQCP